MITVNEKSTARFTLTMTDESGVDHAISTVTSCRWQLTDAEGHVINNRTFDLGLITSPDIILTGEDLAIGGHGIHRILSVVIVYNSSSGSGLTATGEHRFKITDLSGIA